MSIQKLIIMICQFCKEERPKEDFLRPGQGCYKCESRLKSQKAQNIRSNKVILCRICKIEIVHKEDLKKRQRNVFCSPECAKQGHTDINKQYWTRKVASSKVVK